MVALFCGSRNWEDGGAVEDAVRSLPEGSVIIQGGAIGADAWADKYGREVGHHVAEVEALWHHFNKSAGPRRNAAMLKLKPDKVYAFLRNGSPGTSDMIARAKKAGIPVEVVEADD